MILFIPPAPFTEGQAVACIDDDFTILRAQCPPQTKTPVENEVYHVRSMFWNPVTGWGLMLKEINNADVPTPGRAELNFSARRFRPLDEIDISNAFEEKTEEVTEQEEVLVELQ